MTPELEAEIKAHIDGLSGETHRLRSLLAHVRRQLDFANKCLALYRRTDELVSHPNQPEIDRLRADIADLAKTLEEKGPT